MANGYQLRVDSIATDGTNLFFSVTVNDGAHASPPITSTFPVGTAASQIDTYMQTIVDNGYALVSDIAVLAGKTYIGA